MIWLTWRQFRVQALTAAAALAAFAILLAATGPHLASLYTTSKIIGCHGVRLRTRRQHVLQPAWPASTRSCTCSASGSSSQRPRSSASSGVPR